MTARQENPTPGRGTVLVRRGYRSAYRREDGIVSYYADMPTGAPSLRIAGAAVAATFQLDEEPHDTRT